MATPFAGHKDRLKESEFVEPQDIPEIAMYLYEIGKPLHLEGCPGIGKTYIGEVIAEKLAERQGLTLVKDVKKIADYGWDEGEFGLIQSNMSHYEPEDWMMPVIDPKTGKYKREHTPVLPVHPNGLFQIDEIAKTPDTFRFVSQLMDESRIGFDYFLPANTYIVSTSNRATDGAASHYLTSDLVNRILRLKVKPTTEGFLYHHGSDLNPLVSAFLQWFPESILDFDPKKWGDPFASPRSIFGVSRLLNTDFDPSRKNPLAFRVLEGLVGEGWAREFQGLLNCDYDAQQINDMIRDPEGKIDDINKLKTDFSNARSMICSLTMMLAKRVKNDPTEYGPICEFLRKVDMECSVVFTLVTERLLGKDSVEWQQLMHTPAYVNQEIAADSLLSNSYKA
jgi:hypothetical protein